MWVIEYRRLVITGSDEASELEHTQTLEYRSQKLRSSVEDFRAGVYGMRSISYKCMRMVRYLMRASYPIPR